jgi:hypothetical protein
VGAQIGSPIKKYPVMFSWNLIRIVANSKCFQKNQLSNLRPETNVFTIYAVTVMLISRND